MKRMSTMPLTSQDWLRSDYDFQSYSEYIDGKRKNFTIWGATLDKLTNPEDTVSFLKDKYRNYTRLNVTTSLAERYINTYNMERGIISGAMPASTPHIAYIKDSFLHWTTVMNLCEFEKIEGNAEKIVAESFMPHAEWNYAFGTVVPNISSIYKLHVNCVLRENELKKLKDDIDKLTIQQEYTKQITKNLEEMFMIVTNSLSEPEEKNEKSIDGCLAQLYKCIDISEKQEQCYQELGDYISEQNIAFYKRIRVIEIFAAIVVCGITGLIAFNIVTIVISQKQHNEPSRELVCVNNQ